MKELRRFEINRITRYYQSYGISRRLDATTRLDAILLSHAVKCKYLALYNTTKPMSLDIPEVVRILLKINLNIFHVEHIMISESALARLLLRLIAPESTFILCNKSRGFHQRNNLNLQRAYVNTLYTRFVLGIRAFPFIVSWKIRAGCRTGVFYPAISGAPAPFNIDEKAPSISHNQGISPQSQLLCFTKRINRVPWSMLSRYNTDDIAFVCKRDAFLFQLRGNIVKDIRYFAQIVALNVLHVQWHTRWNVLRECGSYYNLGEPKEQNGRSQFCELWKSNDCKHFTPVYI